MQVPLLFTAALCSVAISYWRAQDRAIWVFEAVAVLIGVPLLFLTRHAFPLTPLLYWLFFLHAQLLLMGAHYTYAEVPFGNWLRRHLRLSRNPYDRIGHFAQGFVPAILLRELILRTSDLGRGWWLPVLVVASCLGFSAFYELIEWRIAVARHETPEKFLSTQGDPWDTQWDMCCALVGAISSLCLLSRRHDLQLLAMGIPLR